MKCSSAAGRMRSRKGRGDLGDPQDGVYAALALDKRYHAAQSMQTTLRREIVDE